VSDRVTIIVDVETDESLAELAAFSQKVDELGSKWQRVKTTIRAESRNLLYSLSAFISLAQNIMNQYGIALGAAGDALLNIIGSVISSAIAMQYAYAAGGPIGWAMMAVSSLALWAAIDAQMSAAAGRKEAQDSMNQTRTIMNNIHSMLTAWRY
jgi:hypothetical protein